MKYILNLGLLGIGFLGGIASALFVVDSSFPSTIQVDIHNESGGVISDVKVTGLEGSVTVYQIEPGEAKVVPLLVSGDGTYDIQATLHDGVVLSSHGGYVESGYKVKETIKLTGIEHEHVSFF